MAFSPFRNPLILRPLEVFFSPKQIPFVPEGMKFTRPLQVIAVSCQPVLGLNGELASFPALLCLCETLPARLGGLLYKELEDLAKSGQLSAEVEMGKLGRLSLRESQASLSLQDSDGHVAVGTPSCLHPLNQSNA